MPHERTKTKGVADLVFLVDVSGSMASCIDALRGNIEAFINSLSHGDANNAAPVRDWRGKVVGYRITKVFGPGMMAISYAAQSPAGQKVFFKQSKSPAPTVVWYDAFVAYQKELSARVRNGKAGHFAVRQLEAFEAAWGGRCYFQTYEFVENGADLQQMLDAERRAPPADQIRACPQPDRLGTSCDLGQSAGCSGGGPALGACGACRPQAGQCLPDR